MYHFKKDIDHIGHFWFDNKLIEYKNWALLSQASKSIFPVIFSFRNSETRLAFPDQETIATLSGLSEKTVSNGIKGLNGFPNIQQIPYITRRGRRSIKFEIKVPAKSKGGAFPFMKSVFEGGNWSMLSPSAQALYPVLRYFSWFDVDMYIDYENIDTDPCDFNDIYRDRKYDFFDGEYDILSEHAGFHYRSLQSALNSLKEHELIERYDEGGRQGWKVFLEPARTYKRKFLNEITMKKFSHKIRKQK